jgi:hypothetical protein
MSGKPPSFQFYPKDWISSASASAMSLHERGVYITLLAAAWNSSEPGTLPLPTKATAKAAHLDVRTVKCLLGKWASLKNQDRREMAERSPRDRADVSAISRRCFVEIDGKLVNEELHDQWMELCQFHENAQGRARKGAEARWGKKAALSNQNPCLAMPLHLHLHLLKNKN